MSSYEFNPNEVNYELRQLIHSVLKRNKRLLAHLYLSNKYAKKKLVDSAPPQDLDDLLQVLNWLLTGKIPLKKEFFVVIKRSGRLKHLSKIATDSGLAEMLSKSLIEKAKFLTHVTHYNKLLHLVFNKKE
jgi:hypothetical protein